MGYGVQSERGVALTELAIVLSLVIAVSVPIVMNTLIPAYLSNKDNINVLTAFDSLTADDALIETLDLEGFTMSPAAMSGLPDRRDPLGMQLARDFGQNMSANVRTLLQQQLTSQVKTKSRTPREVCSAAYFFDVDDLGRVSLSRADLAYNIPNPITATDGITSGVGGLDGSCSVAPPPELEQTLGLTVPTDYPRLDVMAVGTYIVENNNAVATDLTDIHAISATTVGQRPGS